MEEERLRSRICGRAQVIFGGAIQVALGTVGDSTDVFAVGLSEFKHPAERAGEEPPSQETFGVQVSLVFPDLETLDNFRSMLDELEGRLKEKITTNRSMNKYKKGDMLVVLQSSDIRNVGTVGEVIDITDGDYYTIDAIPNSAFKEDCVAMACGADLIRQERIRQIEMEGYDEMHDRHHTPQVLARAAAAYALHEDPSKLVADAAANLWPWTRDFWKPKDQLRNLVRAGALIAAAIDRLQREG